MSDQRRDNGDSDGNRMIVITVRPTIASVIMVALIIIVLKFTYSLGYYKCENELLLDMNHRYHERIIDMTDQMIRYNNEVRVINTKYNSVARIVWNKLGVRIP